MIKGRTALLPGHTCHASIDAMKGTARGTWMLGRWTQPTASQHLLAAPAYSLDGLLAYHAGWLASCLAVSAQ